MTEQTPESRLAEMGLEELRALRQQVDDRIAELEATAPAPLKGILYVPEYGHPSSKRWAKVVEAVDRSKKNGFAFVGEFARPGQPVEVEEGAILLCYGHRRSQNREPKVRVCRAVRGAEGLEWEKVFGEYVSDRGWALEVRDRIADLLG